ncbi:MAG TPA: YDG domain-containing protein, partial [Chitinophagales bacterium]|nr:YDG domain-containing protein [Chitinophagales bacterium]
MKKGLRTLAFAVVLLLANLNGWGQLFEQDFSANNTLATYVNATTPTSGQFNALSTSGAGTVVSINSNKLRFARTGNAGAFSRTTDFSPTPTSLMYRFDLTVSGNSAAVTNLAAFQVGSGFGTNNAAEANASVHSRIGLNWTTTAGQFSLRDLTNSANTANYSGTQTITWVMNNSGGDLKYRAPNGNEETVADDKYDLWIGTTRELNDIGATTIAQTLTDLKFAISNGSGTVDIDNFLINPIPSTPTATAASNLSSGGFRANWNTVTGVTGYRVDVSTVSDFSSFVSGYNNVYVSGQATAFLDISGLSGSTTYYYRVRGASQYTVGEFASGNSNVITAATTASGAPPTINSSLTASGTYGTAFSTYTITATNSPTSYNATGLPTGLSVNTGNGQITGTPTQTGSFNVDITATNGNGSDTKTLVITIGQKALTISSISIANKVYDKLNTATISGTPTLVGVYGSDVVIVTGSPTATFNSVNVANGIGVTLSGSYALGGADAAKYTLTQPSGFTANITAKALTVSGAVAQNKVYNGNTTATITGATLVGVESGDAVTVSGGGTFASANVANGISVTAALTLGGAQAGNYSLTQPTGLTANITQASQTITFGPLPAKTTADADFAPGATASSGLTVSYSSSNTSVATIVLGNIHIVGAGATTITASQAGSTNYSAAASVDQTLTVTAAPSALVTFDFAGINGDETSVGSNANATNMQASTITRGAGLSTSTNADRFNAMDWALTSITNAEAGDDYMEIVVAPSASYQFSVNTITINIQRSNTGPSAVALRNSLDSYGANIDGIKSITDNTSTQSFTFNVNQGYSTTAVTYRFYMYAEATGGSGGIGDGTGNDIVVMGFVTPAACSAPATNATALSNTTPLATTSVGLSWTPAPLADGYVVAIRTTNNDFSGLTFADAGSLPAAGAAPWTDNEVAAVVTGSTATINTGLSASTPYYFKVYSYRNCSGNYKFNNSNATGNPLSTTTATPAAEISVVRTSNSANVADGGTFGFGSVNVGSTLDVQFTITNDAAATANLTIPATLTAGGAFSVTAQPGSTSLAPGASTNFTIRYTPVSGASSQAFSFVTNDADENPYNFTLTGTGVPACVTPNAVTN